MERVDQYYTIFLFLCTSVTTPDSNDFNFEFNRGEITLI